VKKEMQMTAPLGADASFNQTKDWKTINWMAVRQQVRRLQVRIAKATGWQMPPRANTEEHRFERLEPYEMKVSRTVPRGGWAGNGLPPLDSFLASRDKNRDAMMEPAGGLLSQLEYATSKMRVYGSVSSHRRALR